MTGSAGRFADLQTRVISALVLAAVAALALMAGGFWFRLLVTVAAGAMAWELGGLVAPASTGSDRSAALRFFIALAAALVVLLPSVWLWPLLALAALAMLWLLRPDPRGLAYLALILAGGLALVWLRGQGPLWALWLIAVVIASDIAGYFAGRMLGGPKFWPSLSPKKTWSGTFAGWLGAALVGLVFMAPLGAGLGLVAVSMLLGLAGQLGDIAESALKRRAGVKDASGLIPGHGGVMDRFDALIAAAALSGLLGLVRLLPGAG